MKKKLDLRTRTAKRWIQLQAQFLSHTKGQNETLCSTAATIAIQLEALNLKTARGEKVSINELTRLTNSFGRVLGSLNIVNWTATPPEEKEPDPLEIGRASCRERE